MTITFCSVAVPVAIAGLLYLLLGLFPAAKEWVQYAFSWHRPYMKVAAVVAVVLIAFSFQPQQVAFAKCGWYGVAQQAEATKVASCVGERFFKSAVGVLPPSFKLGIFYCPLSFFLSSSNQTP